MPDHIVLPEKTASRYLYSASGVAPWLGPGTVVYEPLALLGFLAGMTKRARLGTSVLVIPYRNPVLTAKVLSTWDALTGGRIILGAGVGWIEEEFEALGVKYEDRGPITDEYIQVMKALWTREEPAFEGRFYRLPPGIRFFPKPVQKPHIPVWVGGNTPPALRRAASLGDGWHGARLPLHEVVQARQALHRLLQERGRDPSSFVLSLRTPFAVTTDGTGDPPCVGNPQKVADDMKRYQEAGVHHLVLEPRLVLERKEFTVEDLLAQLHRFAEEVRPRLT